MTQLFTEFAVPKKVIYTVSVLPDDPNTCECAVPNCKTHDDETEYYEVELDVYQCDCCGQWFCISHIKTVNKYDLCVDCQDLPPGIRAQIEAFREELNR